MGMIQSFAPGSIRSVWDMRKALEICLIDLFDEVGSTGCSDERSIAFETDGADGLNLEIFVVDNTDGPGSFEFIKADEQQLIRAWRATGFSLRDTLLALEGSYDSEHDHADVLSLIARWRKLKIPIPEPLERIEARYSEIVARGEDQDEDQGEDEPSEEGNGSDKVASEGEDPDSPVAMGDVPSTKVDDTKSPTVTTTDFNAAVCKAIGPAIAELIAATAAEDSAFDAHAAQEERREKANAELAKLVQRLQACFEEDIALVHEGQLLRLERDDEGTPHCRFSRLISVD
jgi:hypothetical protein